MEPALQASSCLLATDPDRFWRRAGIIAFEDIGVASLETVGIVTASMAGKRFRLELGGEWSVAAAIVARMVASNKNRAADDLFCLTEDWPGLNENRHRLARLPIARLRLIVLTTELLPLRALALQRIFKGGQPNTCYQGSADIGFDVLDELGTAPTTLTLAREGYRRTGEMLAPLLALLSLENGIKGDVEDDLLPPERMIGPLPSWALDMFTREGRKALGLLLQKDAGIRDWARTTIGPTGRVEILAQALFRVESGLCRRRMDGPTSKWLRGWCQTNANQSQFPQARSVSGRAELTPLGESGGAAGLEIVPVGEGALSVEVVVN
jgi:hypothetical protein